MADHHESGGFSFRPTHNTARMAAAAVGIVAGAIAIILVAAFGSAWTQGAKMREEGRFIDLPARQLVLQIRGNAVQFAHVSAGHVVPLGLVRPANGQASISRIEVVRDELWMWSADGVYRASLTALQSDRRAERTVVAGKLDVDDVAQRSITPWNERRQM